MSSPASPPPAAPRPPLSTEDVPWETWSEGTRFGSRFRHLTGAAMGSEQAPGGQPAWESYHVGVQIEELAPGRQSAPAHFHMHEEEHVLVLTGSMTLRLGDERHTLRAGDYECFPAGQRAGHCLINETDAPCRFVMIGEHKADDVIVYTDSQKVAVRCLGERYDRTALRGYWDGE